MGQIKTVYREMFDGSGNYECEIWYRGEIINIITNIVCMHELILIVNQRIVGLFSMPPFCECLE